MAKPKRALGGRAGEPPAEPSEYLTQDAALAYIRAKGIPVAVNFFRDRRSKGTGPPTYYFGKRAMFRRDELDAWIPSIFTPRTWDRRSHTEAAIEARAVTMRARAASMRAKGEAKRRAKRRTAAAGAGEMSAS
jgi:hypothetical protein